MKRIAVVVSCVDAPAHAKECTKWLRANSTPELTDIILVDNGSTEPLPKFDADILVRLEENVGGNAVIPFSHDIMTVPEIPVRYEIFAYLHCDLMVREPGWDKRVLAAFDADPELALVAFVGSDQMNEIGGRGDGTRLNYLGDFYEGFGQCCKAEVHGIRDEGMRPIANLDHCAMIFREKNLRELHDVPYCPTHFYDRALVAECNYRGWHCAYLGISCDHFNGGTAGGIASQDRLIRTWLDHENIPYESSAINRIIDGGNPAQLLPTSLQRPDVVAYVESERRFLNRYRDELRMVPFFVLPDYSKIYWSRGRNGWVSRTEYCQKCKWDRACLSHGGW